MPLDFEDNSWCGPLSMSNCHYENAFFVFVRCARRCSIIFASDRDQKDGIFEVRHVGCVWLELTRQGHDTILA